MKAGWMNGWMFERIERVRVRDERGGASGFAAWARRRVANNRRAPIQCEVFIYMALGVGGALMHGLHGCCPA
jgi:hypothetical protein